MQPELTAEERLDEGIELFAQGRWREVILKLEPVRRSTEAPSDRAEAFFWTAAAEFASGEYENTIADLDAISRIEPSSIRLIEASYLKARALFYLKRFPDAIRLFQKYADGIPIDGRFITNTEGWERNTTYGNIPVDYNRKAAAFYWIGECYYEMKDYKAALGYYEMILYDYRKSHKYESSKDRITLIKQKETEYELRNLLKAKEDIQTQSPPAKEAQTVTGNPAYDEALLAYQNKIAPFIMMRALGEEKGAAPESGPVQPPPVQSPGAARRQDSPDAMERLLKIKAGALEIMERLMSTLNIYDMMLER